MDPKKTLEDILNWIGIENENALMPVAKNDNTWLKRAQRRCAQASEYSKNVELIKINKILGYTT